MHMLPGRRVWNVRALAECLACLSLSLSCAPALAHPVDTLSTGAALDLWSIDPYGAVLMTLLALAYARGQLGLLRRAGARAQRRARAASFWIGWTALAIALGPPLDALTAVSFAAHMGQHEIMMLVAAPLLVMARPLGVLLWGLPNGLARCAAAIVQARAVRRAAAWMCAPLAAWVIHAGVLWGWHVPMAFEAGLASEAMHWLQHASFFAAALIFWGSVFARGLAGERRGPAIISVLTTAIHTTLLGTLLTISARVWYPTYAEAANPWHLSAIEDQQLGGLIMWVPGGMIFVIVGVALMALWLKEVGARGSRDALTSVCKDTRPYPRHRAH